MWFPNPVTVLSKARGWTKACAMGRDTLVVCGLTTECCVAAAVQDAFARDYHVFIAAGRSRRL